MPKVPDNLEQANRPTVLVADDHADTRLMLRVLLEQRGYRVVEAGDGLEAVEAARRERPHLVLMDVSLPTLDGLSAIRLMRECESLSVMPVVCLRARGGAGQGRSPRRGMQRVPHEADRLRPARRPPPPLRPRL